MTEDIPICSKCRVKTEYNEKEQCYVCPFCSAVFYPTREITEYQDEFTSSHEDEQPEIHGIDAGVGLECAEEEDDSITDMLYRSPKSKPTVGYTSSWDSES